MNNKEVAKAFIDGATAKNTGDSLYTEVVDGVSIIFSYGRHFPIAIKFKDGYLFNKDRYSNATSKQQRHVLNLIEYELSEDDYINTDAIRHIVNTIRTDGIRSKAEIIEQKI